MSPLSRKKRKEQAARREAKKKAAYWKHLRHVVFYVLLTAAIVTIRVFYPDVAYTVLDEAQTLAQRINTVAEDVITAVLTLVGLGYALKELWKAFKS